MTGVGRQGGLKPPARYCAALALLVLLSSLTALRAAAGAGAFSAHSPGRNTTVSTAVTQITVYVKHTAVLSAGSVQASINGNAVAATFLCRGTWVEDYDSGELYYAVWDEREGTITVTPGRLGDGPQTVAVSIRDTAGNTLSESWTFTVAERPQIRQTAPANGSEQRTVSEVAAVITDNSGTDWSKTRLIINNSPVTPVIDTATGRISRAAVFVDGTHQVRVETADLAGNEAAQSWSFTVDSAPPAVTVLQHFQNGMVVTGGRLRFYAQLNDAVNIKDNVALSLNGVKLPAVLIYKGEWSYEGDEYHIHSHKEAYFSYDGPVAPGSHTLTLYTEDSLGNKITRSWTFAATTPPVFSLQQPASGSKQQALDRVSATAGNQSNTVDWTSVQVKINGTVVPHTVNTSSGVITAAHHFGNGLHSVYMEAKDVAGSVGSASWSFAVDAAAPALGQLQGVAEGMTVRDGRLSFSARLTDLLNIADHAVLKLNGSILPLSFRYEGFYDYEGDYIVTSRKTAYLSYQGTVGNGSHTLTLTAADELGNSQEHSWRFAAATAPDIANRSPLRYGISDRSPLISARVSAVASISSIVLKINGETVSHNFTGGVVSHTPAAPLADESYHHVSLQVTDSTGQSASSTWSFFISTYPDMYDGNISSCRACHQLYPFSGTAGPWESVHGRRLSFYGSHRAGDWDCLKCHNYITVETGCAQCHGDLLGNGEYDYAPHGSTPEISYELRNHDGNFPVRVLRNREMFDCVICHQPGVNIVRKGGGTVGAHDLPQLHMADDEEGCGECHALSLTREHARAGRTDGDNNPLNCLTCHGSTDAKVREAIVGKDTSCVACHALGSAGSAHSEFHQVSYGAACAGCHTANMMTETQYHASAGCGVCHDSTDAKVSGAISRQKSSCFDCHGQPHGVYMTALRDDLPLYSGVKWGTPQEAVLWNDDGWLPESYKDEQARIIFSRRGAAAADVYQYYSGAMANHGWTLQADTYSAGAQAFSLSYAKGRRYCTVWYFTGDVPGAGGLSGGRILIAYY